MHANLHIVKCFCDKGTTFPLVQLAIIFVWLRWVEEKNEDSKKKSMSHISSHAICIELRWIALKTARVNAIESIALNDNKMIRLDCKIKKNFNLKSAQTQFIINCHWSRTEFLTNRHRTKIIIMTAFYSVNSLVTRNKYLKRRVWVLFRIEMLIEIYYLSESWQKNLIWMGFLKMFCIESAYFQSEANNNND